MLELSFLGASDGVTGSKTLLSYQGKKYLIDCGLTQGEISEYQALFQDIPAQINPKQLEAVFLTHAHADHSGLLPRLVRLGYEGPIYCSEQTRDLVIALLEDSAKIHVSNMKKLREHHPKHAKKYMPLYDLQDVEILKNRIKVVSTQKACSHHELVFSYYPNAHILGSCLIRFHTSPSITFSGDLGRMQPILEAAPIEDVPKSDLLVMESTYGDRLHLGGYQEQLQQVLSSAKENGKIIVMAAFALARTQSLLVILDKLMNEAPELRMPIYLDSPLGIKMTDIYTHYSEHFSVADSVVKKALQSPQHLDYSSQREALIEKKSPPFIIIASSGMLSGGRILSLLETFCTNPNNTLVLTGFQAPGTLGDKIERGERQLEFETLEGKKELTLASDVIALRSLSGHADLHDLKSWAKTLCKKDGEILLNHGETKVKEYLAEVLKTDLNFRVKVINKEEHQYPQNADDFS